MAFGGRSGLECGFEVVVLVKVKACSEEEPTQSREQPKPSFSPPGESTERGRGTAPGPQGAEASRDFLKPARKKNIYVCSPGRRRTEGLEEKERSK